MSSRLPRGPVLEAPAAAGGDIEWLRATFAQDSPAYVDKIAPLNSHPS